MQIRRKLLICLAGLTSMLFIGAPAIGDTNLSQQWFEALSEQDRLLVQFELTWLGNYSGLVDGKFGLETYQAAVEFDALVGNETDGVLTPEQLLALKQRTEEELTKLGTEYHNDAGTGLQYLVPKSVMPTKSGRPNGDIWASASGEYAVTSFRVPYSKSSFEQVFRNLSTESTSRNILQDKLTEYYFTIGGFLDGKSFYLIGLNTDQGTRGISITWPIGQKDFTRISHGIAASLHMTSGALVRSSTTSQATVKKMPMSPALTSQSAAKSTASPTENMPSPIKGWQDVSGLGRPEIEFNADDSGCNMYARNVYIQSVNPSLRVNPQNNGEALGKLIGILGSYAVKRKSYTECMGNPPAFEGTLA